MTNHIEVLRGLVAKWRDRDGVGSIIRFDARLRCADELDAALTALGGKQVWRPIESLPDSSEVVLFCDANGNRWTQCASNWDVPECGLPASFWRPLPPPPGGKVGG